MLTLNSFAISAASLFTIVTANHGHGLHARSHHDVVQRSEHTLHKRFSGTATYYLTGLGACGIYNNPSDKIVALNSAQFGGGYPGPNCFKMITICKGSNCHGAQITDECPTCDYGSLDLSQSLFEEFASTDDGVFPMTWTFSDGSGDDTPKTTSTKKAEPKTTKQPETTKEPEPTTTWEAPKTTSTKKKTTTSPPPETTSTPEPTTSSTSSTPEPTSTSEAKSTPSSTPAAISTSVAPSASASSATASATADLTPDSGSGSGSSSGSNLADANQIMLALGKMAVVANGGQ